VDYDRQGGHTSIAALTGRDRRLCGAGHSAPNFFGVLEDVEHSPTWGDARACFHPCVIRFGSRLLKAPGEWAQGRGRRVGDGQPLGVRWFGRPYFRFHGLQAGVRAPDAGALSAAPWTRTATGIPLTLRRATTHPPLKATSNICTNQGLLVTAATIYMSLLGPEGLERVGRAVPRQHQRTAGRYCQDDACSACSTARCFTRRWCAVNMRLPTAARPGRAGHPRGYSLRMTTRSSENACWCAPPKPAVAPTCNSTRFRWSGS